MKIEQIYTGCLAQGAYYIESEGEAAIIDPLREVEPYLKRAKDEGAVIKYIFETHFHADFVSGHVTLSKETGAPIIYGPTAQPAFEAIIAKDGQEFPLGKLTIKVLHTPGHTMESTTFLLKDESGKDHAIFSGDTLFLGDVGRPDLAQKAAHMTQEELAGTLFDSLRNKIMPLADDVIVYPAHGAGSACGKNMMKETVDTLGNQKKMNYALRADMTREEFIKEVTDGLLPPPQYFPLNVKMNKEGYEDIDTVLERGTQALGPDAFEAAANETGAIVLDVRHQDDFAKGHVPRSIFIGLDGSFAPWVGALIADVKQPILLVTPEGREEETVTRLSRVGFDHTLGYLKGGIEAWEKAGKEIDTVDSVNAEQLKTLMEKGVPVYDVRKESEFNAEHVEKAHLTPLDYINDYLAEFPEKETFYVHCAGGYRSMIASSILKSRGIHNLVDVTGGFADIKKSGIPVTDYVCPTTLK
ncbi:MBL fold metallo-hydrolase [Flagellimonas taeanensis]|jgi:glyoxylase-like metal-dependent hydrolase (beta-lactamase superfamily II)/rhodanese-related sulfurtransferase|uniref:Glyoxylase, beta-lactamase superfamily II n=1 Tax=Flagellimonas taeanensis TaxID=1005926 RepID=A0A1M6Y658_9FLAO|nr:MULTISPECIES: MBL fold metallo-hydrolase [Allomuricauda]MDC6383833.1 MBL fold metallo-hydrolase [Muricauda sp. SK9]MEE1961845.1 MBL fold metallo-hydrolase [Allomuricauda taeanensis]RIV48456.1 MBL fold metallo-hydrolase [Allomuricauda taeanensis]SFC05955.1 Glyoxylase, beta-lactamase superfamily II [Allomuricauda taeanensis]SHL13764.1 Glyoxylase, beta-lactamase superfamily II [Allomuricauda taeanensis]